MSDHEIETSRELRENQQPYSTGDALWDHIGVWCPRCHRLNVLRRHGAEARAREDILALLRVFEPATSSRIPSPSEVFTKVRDLLARVQALEATGLTAVSKPETPK